MFNKKQGQPALPVTAWAEELKNTFKASMSNVFLLTGNVFDYAVPNILFSDYLQLTLKNIKTDKFNGFNRVLSYDMRNGVKSLYATEDDETPSNWGNLIDSLKNHKESTALIINYPKYLFPVGDSLADSEKIQVLSLIQLMNNKDFICSNSIVVLVSDTLSGINPDLLSSSSKLLPINILNPLTEERLEFIKSLYSTSTLKIRRDVDDEQFARLTSGLTRMNIEDIMLLAESKGVLEIESILEKKDALIKKEYGEVIEVFDTSSLSLDDYAGQDHIKKKLYEDLIVPLQEGDISAIPKGLLYTGAPGLGKTYLFQCMAGSIGINSLEFKISKILDKYVGVSEEKLEKAFNCFIAMAPVCVFMDELDTALSRGDNHSNNVASNIFGMFLSFMSREDIRGKVIFIGATNYPNKIDDALKRAGRLDIKVPFFIPTEKERIEVFKIHLNRKKAKYNISGDEFLNLASKTDRYTPSEIENIVIKSMKIAKRDNKDCIDFNTIDYALECLIPASSDDIDKMTELALNEVSDYEYLNDFYKEVKKLMVTKKMSYQDAYEEVNNN